MIEFAIILPIFLLVIGAAIDLGRLFFAYVATENAAKEGAMYGATNPRCNQTGPGCVDPGTVRWHVEQELTGVGSVTHTAVCLRGGAPIALSACVEGDTYRVTVSHTFALVTPILTPIVGPDLDVASRATSLVINKAFDPNATPIALPTPTPTPAPTATPSPGPSGSAGPTPTPTATPAPCTVPNFIGARRNDAQGMWLGARFTGSLTASGNGNYVIRSQTLPAGTSQPCSSSITVGP